MTTDVEAMINEGKMEINGKERKWKKNMRMLRLISGRKFFHFFIVWKVFISDRFGIYRKISCHEIWRLKKFTAIK